MRYLLAEEEEVELANAAAEGGWSRELGSVERKRKKGDGGFAISSFFWYKSPQFSDLHRAPPPEKKWLAAAAVEKGRKYGP